MKALRQNWPDIYIGATNMYHYVHTNPKNFLIQYDVVSNKVNKIYDNMTKVMLIVLKDHIDYWEELQHELIKSAAKKLKLESNITPEDFLEVLNKRYASMKKKNMSWKLYEWKNITNQIASAQDSMRYSKDKEKAFKKYTKVVNDNLENLFRILIDIYNSEDELDKKWADFMGADIPIKEAMPKLGEAKKSIKKLINTLGLSKIFLEDKKTGIMTLNNFNKFLDEYGQKIKPISKTQKVDSGDVISKFFTINTRVQMGLFLEGDDIMQGFAGLFGSLLEEYKAEEIVSARRKGKNKKIKNIQEVNIGPRKQHRTTSDIVEFEWKMGKKTIKAGTSLKLTRFPGLTNKTYNVVDLITKPYLQSIVGGTDGLGISRQDLKTIEWLRMNLQALENVRVGENTYLPPGIVEELLSFEQDMAAIGTLPRLLDGIYNYQKDHLELGEEDDKIYWTALINIRGSYIWVVDIMKEIYNLFVSTQDFKSNTQYIEVRGLTRKSIGLNAKDAWALWNEKRRTIKSLKDSITYANIYNTMESTFENLYTSSKLSASPYSSITMDIKLGNMKQKLGIPTKI